MLDVEFEAEELPEIYNALEIRTQSENGGPEVNLVAEVQQHIGRNQVRAVAMSTTDGVVRGMPVRDTGGADRRSGREAALGRILNVLGEPVDDGAAISRRMSNAGRSTARRRSTRTSSRRRRSSRRASRSST